EALLTLGPEVGLGHLAVDHVPGEELVLAAFAVGEEIDPHPVLPLELPRRLEPDLVAEVIRPAVEALAEAVGREDGGGDPSIARGEEGLDPRALRLRVAELDGGRGTEGGAEEGLLAPRLLDGDVRFPLKGRVRLGDESGDT